MNNLVRFTVSFSLCFLLSGSGAWAQRVLTLEESIEIALDQSFEAKIAAAQLKSSEAAAEAARRSLYSTVDLSFDVPDYQRSLAAEFNPVTGRTEFYPLENLSWSGRLDIDQPLIWTNSTLTLSSSLYREDQSGESLEGGFFRQFFTNFSVIFRQPLFVPNTLGIALERAKIDYEEALAEYKRATLDLIYTVTERFYRLYSSQQTLAIQAERVRQQDAAYTTAQRKYNSGLIAEVDAMQFEVDLAAAKNDLLSSQNAVLSQANGFKLLLGLPLSSEIELVLEDTTFTTFAIDTEQAIGEAKRTRVDLQRARNNITRNKLTLEEVEAQRSIRGDLTLSYGFSNNEEAFERLYVDVRDTRGAMFTVSVPVFDWGKHAQEVQGAKARLQSAELSAQRTELVIEQEITDLVRRIESAEQRVEVLFRSQIVAQKAFEINTKRFESGTIGSLELAQSQARLLQAKLSALEALIDYNVAVADLTRKTAYDFKNDAPIEVRR
ncbi:MAG: hypothetical protein CL946_03435 [Ectothiorhodospiraceae bacterium]|nr:hypothetical protein [Ectothiorhodospiraceae bacterium]